MIGCLCCVKNITKEQVDEGQYASFEGPTPPSPVPILHLTMCVECWEKFWNWLCDQREASGLPAYRRTGE